MALYDCSSRACSSKVTRAGDMCRRCQRQEENKKGSRESKPEPVQECPLKHWVQFIICNHFGERLSDIEYSFQAPDGGEPKKGKLAKGKVFEEKVAKGTYKLNLKLLSNPTWSDDEVKIDQMIKLSATANLFDAGSKGKFEIFDAFNLSGDALESIDAEVNGDKLEAEWTPTEDKLKEISGGKIQFIASVEKSQLISTPIQVKIKCEFELQDLKEKTVDTEFTLYYAGEQQVEGTAQEGVAELFIPMGEKLLQVKLKADSATCLALEEIP